MHAMWGSKGGMHAMWGSVVREGGMEWRRDAGNKGRKEMKWRGKNGIGQSRNAM